MNGKIFCIFMIVTSSLYSQILIQGRPIADYIANTGVFEENQTRPHAPIAPFEKVENALTNDWSRSPWVISLNGVWKFQWHETPAQASWTFFESGVDVRSWDEIDVPSNWQMQGFGDPMFRNINHPFPADPPNPPSGYNPTGSYRRSFTVPDGWEKRRIMLYFEGVKSAAFIWVNGHYAGYNEGGMEPAEFEVTGMIHPGENQLAVQVLRFADATYLEDQDMWRLSGIYRPVYLLAMPEIYIRDYYVTTDLDSLYQDADLHIAMDVMNYTGQQVSSYAVACELYDTEGRLVRTLEQRVGTLDHRQGRTLDFHGTIGNPSKWSAEKPNLYVLVLSLRDQLGRVIHTYAQGVGFREVEVRDQALWINGVPVKLNGVCSHVHHPVTGRTMDVETMRRDLILMKQFNINCVRTSHYPQNREYYDLADRLGMYVIDETNDEAHCTPWMADDPDWRAMYLDRASKMVCRDRNHASVIIWSAGNESGDGANICDLIAEGKRIDPSRPAWLYGGNNDYYPGVGPMDCEDIVGPRYPTPVELETGIAQSDDPRPSFMDEYGAVTGNGGGMFDEFWEVIRAYPRTIGGAVWDWVSPSVQMNWIVTPDQSPCGNDGAIMGRHALVPGPFGKALELSGHDAWVEIYRAPELDCTGEALTLSLRVKPKAWDGPESFLTKGNWQFGLRQPVPDSLEFYLTTHRRVSVKAKVPGNWTGFWHRLTATYNGEMMRLTVDDQSAAVCPQNGPIVHTIFPINLGRNCETDDQDFTGMMSNAQFDRVAVFDRAVPDSEMTQAGPEDARLWLDFESEKILMPFYSTGIGGRTYGLIWADRRPQPELYQLKKSGQPVTVRAVDPGDGRFQVTNWHHFTHLNELSGTWELTSNGKMIKKGTLDLDLAPLASGIIELPVSGFHSKPGVQSCLTLSWTLPAGTAWADAGHEVAFEQFEMPADRHRRNRKVKNIPGFHAVESDTGVMILGKGFKYIFSKKIGGLISFRFKGQELIREGPHMNAWRAPLANDLDRWTFGRANTGLFHPAMSGFAVNGFMAAGLDRIEHVVDRFEIEDQTEAIQILIRTHAAAPGTDAAFGNRYVYVVQPSGDMVLTHTITPEGSMPNWLPKLGLRMVLNRTLRQWIYLGRGPFENYPDRKTGAKIGLWKTTVDDAYVPYLIPQDHANRSDVTWTAFSNESVGLFIQAEEPLNVSAHIWDEDNLSRAFYIPQLRVFDGITVHIDPRVSGVGCTAVSVLEPYRVRPEELTYTIRMKPFDVQKTRVTDLGREPVR